MSATDIDLFIQEQKQRLAADRQRLGSNREGFPPSSNASGNRELSAYPPASTAQSQPPASQIPEFPRPQSNQSNSAGGESAPGLFSKLGAYEETRRAFDESRREDYLKLRKPAPANSAIMSTAAAGGKPGLGIVGGLRDSTSAKQRKERERNAEYNEYLRMKEQEQQRKRQPQQQQQPQPQLPRVMPGPEAPLQQPPPQPPPQLPPQQAAPRTRIDFTSLDDLERRVAELRNIQQTSAPPFSSEPSSAYYQPPAQPLAASSYHYNAAPATVPNDPVRRLEQLEAEYESLRRQLRHNQPVATTNTSRLEATSYATKTSSNRGLAPTETTVGVGGAIDTRRPDTASQRERKRQAYKAELERQLAEQKQQKQQQQKQQLGPSFQEKSAIGFGDIFSSPTKQPAASATTTTNNNNKAYLSYLDNGPDGDDLLLNYAGLDKAYEGAPAAQSSRVRFVEPSASSTSAAPPVGGGSGGGAGVLALGSEQERKAQAAARQKAEYAKELERQMAEKKAAEARRKREREEFEKRKEAEIAAYDPFGKGGGGAPIKDANGNTRANLKQLMREADEQKLGAGRQADGPTAANNQPPRYSTFDDKDPSYGLNDKDWDDQLTGLKDLQARLSKSFTDDLGDYSPAATNSRQQPQQQTKSDQTQQQPPQHARGGHGIFGRGLSDEQKRQRERYQEELRQQVEEQRRAKEEERRRQAEEDLKEQRRAEEQQRRMQAEAEAERRRQAEKEEAARRKNEELRLAAEEQRKQAAASRRRREPANPSPPPQQQQQQQRQRPAPADSPPAQRQQRFSPRAASPPVPAIRTQMEAPPRQQKPATPRNYQHQQQQLLQRQSTAASVSSAPEPESIEQLARLRNQLRSERRRIEEALEAGGGGGGGGGGGHGGTNDNGGAGTYRVRGSSAGYQVDVFDMARDRRKPVAAKRNIAASSGGAVAAAAAAAAAGSNRGRRSNYDDLGGLAPADLGLGGAAFESMQLDSESAFVDIDQPLSPNGFDSAVKPAAVNGSDGLTSPTVSLDVDRIDRANEARLRRLQRLQADAVSLNDPEEVLNRFMSRQARPVSGQTGLSGDD